MRRIESFLAPGWNRKASKSCTPENLEQSYAVFDSNLPHAVLLDVQLGREDGRFFARWMRQRQSLRDIPILAVTAHAMVTDQERVIEAGCDACISKPVDFKLLSDELRHWLKNTTG